MAIIPVSAYNSLPKLITGIYCITNVINGKKYVGQSIDIRRRLLAHCRSKRKSNSAIGRAIIKYGLDAFTVEILATCDRDGLGALEKFYIDELNTVAPDGYNLVSGGNVRTKISDETRVRMSKSHIGKVRSLESIEKQRQKTIGIKRSPETLIKMSAWQKGKPKTEEFIEKMRKSLKGRISPNKGRKANPEAVAKMIAKKIGAEAPWRWVQLIRSDGAIFKSIIEAALSIGVHRTTILKHLAGKLKTVHGYTFTRGGVSSQL